MKLNKFFILAVPAVIALSSCVDLDYNEVSVRDEEWNYSNPNDGIKNMVWDVYAQIYNNEFSANSDNYLASATDEASFALTTANINKFINGGWSPANPFSNTWTKSYRALSEIHYYLENIHKVDLSEYQYESSYSDMVLQYQLFPYELRFLRAYYYFQLVKTYGDVPLVTTTLTNGQANTATRTPASQIFDFIVRELDECAPYLPITYEQEPGMEIGRATRVAAYALKARTLLYAASPLFNTTNDKSKWAEAAEAAKYVIDNAKTWGLSLSTYSALWGNDAFFNKEIIFGIGRGENNDFEKANYPIGIENGSSGNCPTQSLVDQYEYQDNGETFAKRNPGTIDLNNDPYAGLDPRFELTIVKNGDTWPTNGAQKRAIETFNGGKDAAPIYGATPTGYYLKKYVDGACVTTADNQTSKRHTWIVMRLAEMYLDYAEAVFNATGSATDATYGMTANEAVNVLRTREDINMPKFREDGEAWVERYERERLVEFAFEDQRFWDVRRWKKGAQYFKNVNNASISADLILTREAQSRTWDDKYYLFPIPQSEIQINPNLTQNPGW